MIYLASQSPRRAALLQQIGVTFTSLISNVAEIPAPGEIAENYVTRIAFTKAKTAWQLPQRDRDIPVLAADTEVVLDGNILGKPRDATHALIMLQQLSGRSHKVVTTVVVGQGDNFDSRQVSSTVTFRDLSEAECQAYIATGEPLGKAGAYAVQGLAAIFIVQLVGSYTGVVGLPLYETAELLMQHHVAIMTK